MKVTTCTSVIFDLPRAPNAFDIRIRTALFNLKMTKPDVLLVACSSKISVCFILRRAQFELALRRGSKLLRLQYVPYNVQDLFAIHLKFQIILQGTIVNTFKEVIENFGLVQNKSLKFEFVNEIQTSPPFSSFRWNWRVLYWHVATASYEILILLKMRVQYIKKCDYYLSSFSNFIWTCIALNWKRGTDIICSSELIGTKNRLMKSQLKVSVVILRKILMILLSRVARKRKRRFMTFCLIDGSTIPEFHYEAKIHNLFNFQCNCIVA